MQQKALKQLSCNGITKTGQQSANSIGQDSDTGRVPHQKHENDANGSASVAGNVKGHDSSTVTAVDGHRNNPDQVGIVQPGPVAESTAAKAILVEVDQLQQQQPSRPVMDSDTTDLKEFVVQLLRLLRDNDNKHVIAWSPNGRIEVHSPQLLETTVLRRYFPHTTLEWFHQLLHRMGFREEAGPNTNGAEMSPYSFVNERIRGDLGSLRLTQVGSTAYCALCKFF